ncbi:MAG: amidohydrolase family protein [Lentisphaeria bacterium]|nr:amidohydrolase family protein [Lentisphaeria bacterium]
MSYCDDFIISDAQKELIARVHRADTLGEFIFDVHGHTNDGWSLASVFDGTSEGLHWEMEQLGVSGLAVSAICAISGVDFEWANNALMADIQKQGNKIHAYVGIDIMHGKTLVADVENYLNNGFKGGKIYTRWGIPYNDPAYYDVFELLNARKLPCLAHCWGEPNVSNLAKAAVMFPDINFIAAHTGSADLDVYLDKAARHDNFYIDTAISGGPRGLIEKVVSRIGSEKLCFGSDAALFSMAQQVSRVIAARISDDDRRNILGLNAKNLFY